MNFNAYYKKLEDNKKDKDNIKKNIETIKRNEDKIKKWLENVKENNIITFSEFRTYFNGGNNQLTW